MLSYGEVADRLKEMYPEGRFLEIRYLGNGNVRLIGMKENSNSAAIDITVNLSRREENVSG